MPEEAELLLAASGLAARDFVVILDIDARVRPDKEFRADAERPCGPDSLEILAN